MFNPRIAAILIIALSAMNLYLMILGLFTGDLRKLVFSGTMLIVFYLEFKYLPLINEEIKEIYAELKEKYKK